MLPEFGQCLIPAGLTNAVAVAGGNYHSLTLQADGTVVAWGAGTFSTGALPQYGQSIVPDGLNNVVAIAAGTYHSLALQADGSVVAWGSDTYGQSSVPADLTNVVAIAGGNNYSLALKADGRVVVWGANIYGQTNVPPGQGDAVALAGGGYHNLVLEGDGRPRFTVEPVDRFALPGTAVALTALAVGRQPLSYQWQRNGIPVSGATGASLVLPGIQVTDAGSYSVVVTNELGYALSRSAELMVPGSSPPRFDLVTPLPGSQVRLVLSGESGNYAVEVSSDLAGWNPWTNVTISTGAIELLDAVAPATPPHFYRATSAP